MKLNDELLLKYAEGDLASELVANIETALQQDVVAAERLRLLQLSGAALQKAAAIPPSQQKEDPLAQLIRNGDLDAPSLNDAARLGASQDASVPKSSGWSMMQMAASIALLILGLGTGYFARGLNSNEPVQLLANPIWLVRIVDYHTLYVRQTVSPARADTKTISALKQRFATVLGQEVTIPDLGNEQLEFRRGQYLKFEDSPIIQLAYLPKNVGRPVALCLKAANGPDLKPTYSFLSGLGIMRWRQGGLDYVLVGDLPEQRLRSAANNAHAQIGKART